MGSGTLPLSRSLGTFPSEKIFERLSAEGKPPETRPSWEGVGVGHPSPMEEREEMDSKPVREGLLDSRPSPRSSPAVSMGRIRQGEEEVIEKGFCGCRDSNPELLLGRQALYH